MLKDNKHISVFSNWWSIEKLLITVNLLLQIITANFATADVTNTWHFTNYIYNLSNPLVMEINTNMPGYVQLVLQTQNKYYTTLADYTNAFYRNRLALGYDSCIRLSGSPGTYSQSGSFISRILDGGGGGNIWQSIKARVENDYHVTDPTLVAYYRMDNDNWLDGATAGYALPSTNSIGFSADAAVGTYSSLFDGHQYVYRDSSLPITSAFTVSFWVKALVLDEQVIYFPISVGYGASEAISIRVGGPWASVGYTAESIALVLNGQPRISSSESNTFSIANDLGIWRHIVVIYDDAASPRTRIFKDGIEIPTVSQNASGNVMINNKLNIGRRVDAFWYWNGYIDGVVIWNKALTTNDVARLYTYRYRDLQPFKMQVRSGTSPADVLVKAFVGIDGTTNSFYYNESITNNSINYNPADRYVQYMAYFDASTNRTQTPLLSSVGIFGDQTVAFDNNNYDFIQGSYTSITNEPAASPTPSLGLAKDVNGGYFTNGTYTSRTIDAGGPGTWNTIFWKVPSELSSTLSGLVGLWHMNWSWGSDKGGFVATPQGGATFTGTAKFGNGSGLFNGSGARVDINIGVNNQSLEFWIKDANINDGIMEIATAGGTAYLSISNHTVTVTGNYGTSSKLYVNGDSACLKLLNGWNHVAIVFGSSLLINSISLGIANGDFAEGAMDEMATYNYGLTLAEVNAHFTSGRRFAAGTVQAQVRYGDALPLTNSFTGPGGFPTAYYGNGNPLSFDAQYLQYKMFFAGDGDATPIVDSVTLNYEATTFIDDTQTEFTQGSFDNSQTVWYGDDIKLLYPASVGPANLNLSADPFGMNLWHLDEASWLGGGSIVIDSRGGMNGNPYGNANTVPSTAVGSYCGSFGGSGAYLDLTTINLSGEFSINLWFNTINISNRMVLLSSDNGGGTYFTIEVNGNGSATTIGKAALTVFNGSTVYTALANREALNDGKWHNLVAVRAGSQIHIYIDGEREGTANIGAGYGSLGNKTVYAGARPRGSPDLFYNGLIDEVAVWSRSLTEAEIGNNYAGGFRTQGTGEYISETVDASDQAIWQTLSWVTDGPYSKPLSGGDLTLVGLWHMEEAGSPITNSVGINDGTFAGGVTAGTSGRFGKCLDFNGTLGFVSIAGPAVNLEPPNITVEAWINADDAVNRPIFDKSDGGANGYVIGLDVSGKPYFKVGATVCTGYLPVRVGKWTHIAGCFDSVSSRLRLYIDGELAGITDPVAVSPVSGQPAIIGRDALATGYFDGKIDEVAVHNRVLLGEEILDHYRSGAVTLKFQARSSTTDPTFTGLNFLGPDKTTNTFFVDSSGSSLIGSMDLGRYLQYKAYFASDNYRLTPKLSGVRVYVANYPTANPMVEPDVSHAIYFPGRLRGFTDLIIQGGPSANVRYQISGDSSSWYWWNGVAWASNSPSDYNFANPVNIINANITNFFELFYPKTGGDMRFRAFLHSEGDYQIQVDKINFVASAGRIVVTVPDGLEVGSRAWVVGTPQTIRWTTDGIVSANLVIELYNNSGSNFVTTLASGIPNTSNYTVKISDNIGTTYRIKIRDANDSTIHDMSDNDFWLIQDFHITVPDGGEHWYIGQTNVVRWDSPGPTIYDLGSPAALWFSNDGGTNWIEIVRPVNAIGNNQYAWNTPSNDARLVSEIAKMGVSIPDVSDPVTALFGDDSDGTFVMAGIVVTYPSAGIGIKMGNPVDISWNAAGAGTNGVQIDLFNGVEWTNLTMNAPCIAGSNSFNTVLTAPNPASGAKIKITANEFPAVWGVSGDFTLADINIITPRGGTPADRDHWPIGTTNYITWTSGGAGDIVDVEYSPTGTNWLPIAMGYSNVNSSAGNIVTNWSPQWIIPGPPSSNSYIRIRSVTSPSLYAITQPFDMAGVQIVSPNGGEVWEFTATNDVTWLYQGAGANLDVQLAYVDNPTTNDYELIDANINILSGRRSIAPSKVRRPTNFGRVRIKSTTLPMFDTSDNAFTIRGLSMTFPQSNAVYTMGMNVVTGLQWFSAATEDTSAEVYYSIDGTNFTDLVLTPLNIDAGAGDNKQNWLVPRNVLPSDTAELKVVAGSYFAMSPRFILRGIRITQPTTGVMYDIGTNRFVTWRAAGLQFSARIAGALSTTGLGGPYSIAGLTTNVPAANGSTSWSIDPELVEPTTNAIIRFACWTPTNDTDIIMYSDPFTLRGLKFVSPSQGTNWALGSSVNVSFLSAGMGNGARATIYYSPDGITFDTAKPVTNNLLITDGLNNMTWTIENSSALTRMPSTNAVLRIVSGSWSTDSKPFRLSGIKITSPALSDIWAVTDLTNTIRWVAIDTINSYTLSFTVWLGTFPVTTQQIATGVTGNSYDWTMVPAAIGSNVTITITDGTATGQSERFEVVAAPSIRIINPAAGDFWKVTESNLIRWIQGGKMSNAFVLTYSTYPYGITNLLRVGSFPVTNNVFSYTWDPIPNALGQTRIIVTNIVNASIGDQFDNFSIAAKFDIVPFSGDMYALSPVGVNWVTRGDVSSVDLYYSTDPLRSTASWQRINTEGPYSANIGHNLPATPYPWTVANYKTNTMWLRVQDHTYSNQVFDASKPGPYDDTGPFEVKYYRITWRVFDVSNTQQLDNISMQDNLGWSASDLLSPIVREYPFGTWTVVFYREFFHDLPFINWEAKPSRTNDIFMSRAEIEPEPHVLANFAYDIASRKFTIHSWLERNGQIMKTPSQGIVSIFKSDGTQIETITSVTPDQNGVFWSQWDIAATETRRGESYVSTDIFFARVEIKYSGTTYSAGLTLQLRLAAGEDTVAAIQSIVNQATSNIMVGVNMVGSNVTAFRGDTGTTLSNLMAVAQATRADVSGTGATLSNLTAIAQATRSDISGMSNVISSVTNAILPAISSMTNEMIGVLGPTITNINAQMTNMAPDMVSDLARILERSTTVTYGSTNRILYKSRKGYDSSVVFISVSSPAQGVTYSGNMAEIVPGIYENELIANWGVDSYTVTCSDPLARDSIVLTVTAIGGTMEDVPPMISAMTNRLNTIETHLINVQTLVSGIQGTDLSGVMSSIDDVRTAVQDMNGAQIDSSLRTLASQIGSINDSSSANSFFGQIARVNEQLGGIGYNASEAFKKARAAQNEAGSAAGAIGRLEMLLKKDVKEDIKVDIKDNKNKGTILATLEDILADMEAAKKDMKDIPALVRIGGLYDALSEMSGQMKKLAESKQFKIWTKPPVEKPEPGIAVPETPEESLIKLTKGVEEMKGSILFMQKLIDEKRYEPVVTDELQGVVE
ncbi:MAG: LamG domain-containing protein [Kiritimatiellae bacterium]|nr:LamG domain-containing protein [Kiritimatiellia bacterium]MDD5521924.1 LamG domain-containing protein [Kiritimatiellia bacterium]